MFCSSMNKGQFTAKGHIFVCVVNRPPSSEPSCGASGSGAIMDAIPMILLELGIENVRVNGCTCLGPCDSGTNLVIYPEGVFYTRVRRDNLRDLLESHFVKGEVFEALKV